MKKQPKLLSQSLPHYLWISLVIAFCLIALYIIRAQTGNGTRITGKAVDSSYVLKTTVTSPPWGTEYTWKDKATITATVEHTNPLNRVVFTLHAGSTSKDICVLTAEPFNCTYTVPYTGSGAKLPVKGAKAGYVIDVHAYDTMGHIGIVSHQLWSHK